MSNPPAIKSRRILPNPNHDGITTTTWILISLLLLCSMPKHAAGQNDTATASSQPDTVTYGQRFNPSMAIIMVVLVSAFFLMGFFSVYIRQCAEGRMRGGGTEAASATGQYAFGRRSLRGTARGLDPAVIGTFPTFLYSSVKGLKIGKGSLECAVCLNEFLDDDVLRLLPRCSHVFHPDCIDAWLSSHITCPVCRANLVPKPGENIDPPTVQTTEPGADHGELPPAQVCVPIEGHHRANNTDAQPPQVEENPPMDQSKPPRSRSTGMRFTRLFPFSRSHSTGHSLIQPGEDRERFTLRLPEEVRNQIIMDARLNRAKSCTVAFPRVRSVRTGYRRSDSGGITRGRNFFNYERFDREERTGQWGFSMAPPFIRTGSARSSRGVRSEETGATPPKSSPKPGNSSQFDRLFWGLDVENGERSTDKLRPETQV